MFSNVLEAKEKLKQANQGHLLQFWDELTESEQENFLNELNDIPLDDINDMFNRAQKFADLKSLNSIIKPIPKDKVEIANEVPSNITDEYYKTGLEEISKNSVAVLLLAGGQGSRLGVHYPKGMFSVGLPSNKSLYQLQAERILKVLNLAEKETGKKCSIPWYIMTSESTNDLTQEYFEQNNFFGLSRNDIIVFQQGDLPCFDFNGKILLNSKCAISLAPDGNGGMYSALKVNGILEDMELRGVNYIHVYGVDNILTKVADPIFLGYCITKKADCGAKVINKKDPSEPLGVICKINGHFKVVEYSEIDPDLANLRDENNELIFNAGSICNHFFTRQFICDVVKDQESALPLHIAKKKIPCINEKGEHIDPSKPNGYKIEKFIFDVFQFSNNFVTWEVDRFAEFSPIKNSDDAKIDCPSTARNALLNLHKIYIEKAGGVVLCDEVEISPTLSYAGEDLEFVKGERFCSKIVLS